MTKKTLIFYLEYDHCQYYQGHGHTFESPTFKYCLPTIIPLNIKYTLGELKTDLLHELNQQEFPNNLTLTNSEILDAFAKTLGNSKFNGMSITTLFNLTDDPSCSYDEWYFYGYLHIHEDETKC